MIALLMGLLADVVFQSASATHQSFGAEMTRYMEQRGLIAATKTTTPRH